MTKFEMSRGSVNMYLGVHGTLTITTHFHSADKAGMQIFHVKEGETDEFHALDFITTNAETGTSERVEVFLSPAQLDELRTLLNK